MAEENTQKTKILLVDDDHLLLDMYSLKFSKGGLEPDPVPSGAMALAKLREGTQYDIILLDIIMPGLDGLALLKTIRDEKLSPNAVIVMLTNQADEIDRAKALGVDGYIVKASTIPSEVVQKVLSVYNNKHKQ